MNKPDFYITLFFLSITHFLFGQQNLVYNGGFDILNSCTDGNITNCDGWFSYPQGTPDVLNSCISNLNFSSPSNIFGFQEPYSGSGYAGIVAYTNTIDNVGLYREYIQTELIETLKPNSYYLISFYYSVSNNSPFAIKHLNIGFDDDSISYNSLGTLSPKYFLEYENLQSDSSKWNRAELYYKATGDERVLCLGNLKLDSETDFSPLNLNSSEDTYYYVDDVSVEPISLDVCNVFTPNNDGLNDIAFQNEKLNFLKVDIINRWGNLVTSNFLSSGWDGLTNTGLSVSEGVYFFRIYDPTIPNEPIDSGFIHLIR